MKCELEHIRISRDIRREKLKAREARDEARGEL